VSLGEQGSGDGGAQTARRADRPLELQQSGALELEQVGRALQTGYAQTSGFGRPGLAAQGWGGVATDETGPRDPAFDEADLVPYIT